MCHSFDSPFELALEIARIQKERIGFFERVIGPSEKKEGGWNYIFYALSGKMRYP